MFLRMKTNRRLLWVLLCVAVALGALDGFFGRTFYTSEAVPYLDIVRALHAGDWKTALSAYWGLGYPLLLALWLPLFPSNVAGEWIGVHCLNLLILAATFFSFYSVVDAAFASIKDRDEETATGAKRYLILLSFPVFLAAEVFADSVSRIGSDMLASCVVFAAAAALLRIGRRSRIRDAIVLGVLLGAGYVVETLFLPLLLVFVALELVLLWHNKRALSCLAATLISMGTLAVPYAAGMTWAFGHRTLGEYGGLNYAWFVNHLHLEVFWEGGPSGYGMPEHPPRQVMTQPSLYLFGGPQPVTYPPWFNPPYFYYGYRQFFNFRNQLHAVAVNMRALIKIVARQPAFYFLLWGLFVRRRSGRFGDWIAIVQRVWPMIAIVLAGVAINLVVHTEVRYISSFLGLFLLAICLLCAGGEDESLDADVPRRARITLFALLLISCIVVPIAIPYEPEFDPVRHLARHEFFWNAEQVKAGEYLMRTGARPGEKVGLIAGSSGVRCTWAYIAHLRIIAQVGGNTPVLHPDDPSVFWHAAREKQKQILETLHNSGAQLVVAFEKPADVTLVDWEAVPGTGIWIYRNFK